MSLLLATHLHRVRIEHVVANHPDLQVLPRIVVNNKDPNRGENLFSHDALRRRRDIGMHCDAALACDDSLLLCLNDDVRPVSPCLNLSFLPGSVLGKRVGVSYAERAQKRVAKIFQFYSSMTGLSALIMRELSIPNSSWRLHIPNT